MTSLARLRRLAVKELRETIRDRRTIITLVLMPLLVYPILSVIFQRFLLTEYQSTPSQIEYHVGFDDSRQQHLFEELLREGSRLRYMEKPKEQRESGEESGDANPSTFAQQELAQHAWEVRMPDATLSLEDLVSKGTIDVGVRVIETGIRSPIPLLEHKLRIELISRDKSALSRDALQFLKHRIEAVNNEETRLMLSQRGITPVLAAETEVRQVKGKATGGFSMATLVPLILILMTITGAVYPAIDLTAGERERGTMETLIAAPIPRIGLLLAKYIVVVIVALLTAMVNIAGMFITIWAFHLEPLLFGEQGMDYVTLLQIGGLLVLFAGFFSAVLLVLTSFAKSFKEAQAYLIPLMLVSMTPGFLALMPGIELNFAFAVIPLVNIVLLARDLFDHQADFTLALVAIISTIFYAFAAISLAAKIFGTDAILTGSEGTWSDLFRRPATLQSIPKVNTALFCLAIVFPLNFIALGGMSRIGDSVVTRILYIAGSTIVVFALVPVLLLLYSRVRLVEGLGLRARSWLPFLAAIAIGMASWPFVAEYVRLLPQNEALRAQQVELAEKYFEQVRTVPPWMIVLCLGLAPAFCEELFFRGILMRAFQAATGPYRAVLISSIAFGVFHVLSNSTLSVGRFVPTTIMGLILGWVACKSGSILPSIVLHTVHNSCLHLIGYYQNDLLAAGWISEEQTALPLTWMVAAGTVLIVGVLLLRLTPKPPLIASP